MLRKKEFLKYSKLLSDLDNVHSIPSLKGASLCTITSSSKSNSKSFKDLLSVITALELVSLQRPFLTRKKTTSSFRSDKKGSPTGAKVTLNGKNFDRFLLNLFWKALPQSVSLVPRTDFSSNSSSFVNFSFPKLEYLFFPVVRSFYMFLRNSGSFFLTFRLNKGVNFYQLTFIRYFYKIPF
jgi:ribosomal protein L5